MDTKIEKSPREIAGEIVLTFREQIVTTGFDVAEAINAIEKALRDRDERAAKKCDLRIAEISNYQTRPYRIARRELESIASAIRGKSNV